MIKTLLIKLKIVWKGDNVEKTQKEIKKNRTFKFSDTTMTKIMVIKMQNKCKNTTQTIEKLIEKEYKRIIGEYK